MRVTRRLLGSILPLALFAVPTLAAPGCTAAGADARGIMLDDPLGLVMDVAHAGNPLRVYVLPSSSYACQAATGAITPDIPDAMPGSVPDAVVDISADVSGDMASAMAMIPVGDWTVLVRGKGTDSVSGSPNVIIATGCATVSALQANETRQVNITLLPVHANGRCMDGVLSPDEQCEPPGSTLCDASCHTTPFTVNMNLANGTATRMSSTTGQRIAVAFDSAGSSNDIGVRMLDVNGGMVGTTGTSLARDEPLDNLGMALPGPQNGAQPAMAADGHFALAFNNLFPSASDDSDVVVQFFSADRAPSATTPVRTPSTGVQNAADAAYAGNGALMVVYEDTMSATGISATFFAAGSTTVLMGGVAIGTGTTMASHPSVAGLATGFVVAFSAGGDVRYQRFTSTGTAMDATPLSALDAVDATDTQDEPSVAANTDGSFLIAWMEHSVALGDGMGTSIRARAFSTAGMPAAAALVLPTTGAAGDQHKPDVAAADGRYIVAWASCSTTVDAMGRCQASGMQSVHARVVSGMGAALPNREQPQTTNDFVVAATGNAPSVVAMGGMAVPASWLVGYDDGSHALVRRYPR